MKILIVTAWYAPFIHPRAHRWTSIAEYWAANGHEIHVITARVQEQAKSNRLKDVQVHRVGFDSLKEWVYFYLGVKKARGRVGIQPEKTGLFAMVFAWVYQTIWKRIYFPDDACIWYFPARKQLHKLLKEEAFDAIITVSLPFTGHLLGLSASRKRSVIEKASGRPFPIWLVDIGDPFSFQAKPPNNPYLFSRLNRALEFQILKSADAVAVTTEATSSKYQEQFGAVAIAKMVVIPPLFSMPFRQVSDGQPPGVLQAGKTIKLGYFGAFYAPTRTPNAFIWLLDQIYRLRPELRGRLEVHFYGEIFPEFFAPLQSVPGLQLHGLCSRIEAWEAMQEMDFLLSIGNSTDFQLPSKVVDYLATGKPILHLSYVQEDPVLAFFADSSAPVFRMEVQGNRVELPAVQNWIEWMESAHERPDAQVIFNFISPYKIEQISQQYLALLT